ncbi:MAG: hypothetical protein J2P36_29035 [Ktedonobacteraceae bacterium]|nr:hypothetical protein [Ktedonobacteraceae bacterium]
MSPFPLFVLCDCIWSRRRGCRRLEAARPGLAQSVCEVLDQPRPRLSRIALQGVLAQMPRFEIYVEWQLM